MSGSQCRNILCSTKGFTKGLICEVKTTGDLEYKSSGGPRTSNLSYFKDHDRQS